MRVDLHFTPHQIDELGLRDKTIVVIDVLRASTSIATAMYNGAKEIIPVTSVERAVKISGSLFGDHVLRGGERNGKMIEGFNLGNSPFEYSEEKIRGKAIIFSSTNGSLAIEKARFGRNVLIAGFVNVSTVAHFIKELQQDFILLCAGNNGMFSLEDSVCAGMLVHQLTEDGGIELSLSDAAIAATMLYKGYSRSLLKMVKNSEHGRYLKSIGLGEDLPVCAGVDTIPVLPQLVGNVIKVRRDDTEKAEAPKVPVMS
jgi:2-phosphosulfolactate phosphatase